MAIGLLLKSRELNTPTVLDIYSNIFGYSGSPLVYPIKVKEEVYETPPTESLVVDKTKPLIGDTQLSYLKLTAVVKAVKGGIEVEEEVGFDFPLGAIIHVETSNRLIKRFAQREAGKGSVKELWQDDDYKVTIKAVLDAGDQEFPYDIVKALSNLCLLKKTIKVSSPYLRLFDITNLAIETYKFNEVSKHTQTVEIVAISDYSDSLL